MTLSAKREDAVNKHPKLGKDIPALWDKANAELPRSLRGQATRYWKRVTYPKPIAPEEIKVLRASLKLSQLAFAQAIGQSISTVRSWEQGSKRPGGLAKKVLRAALKDAHIFKLVAAA